MWLCLTHMSPGSQALTPCVCCASGPLAVLDSDLCLHQVWECGFKRGAVGRLQELWRDLCGGSWGLFLGLPCLLACKGRFVLGFEGDGMCCSFALPLSSVYICSVTWYLLPILSRLLKRLLDRVTYLLLNLFWDRVSCSPRWPRTPAVA